MKCNVQFMGWCASPADVEWQHPNGYYRYLLIPANGVIRWYNEWADSNKSIVDGEYDLPDALFDFKNIEFDSEVEKIYE